MLNAPLSRRCAGRGAVRDQRPTHRATAGRATAGLAVVGLLALALGGSGLYQLRPAPGDVGSTGPASPPHAPPTASTTATSPTATSTTADQPTDPATLEPAPAPAPTELAIPAIKVKASIVPVGTVDGALLIPEHPRDVGWWAGSAPPAAGAGSVVLAGHVDSVAGPGALFRLTELRPGAEVTLVDAAGTRHRFTVTGRRVLPKTADLPADLFAADGPHRLVIITCGGPFDRTTHRYRDNVIVFAAPA